MNLPQDATSNARQAGDKPGLKMREGIIYSATDRNTAQNSRKSVGSSHRGTQHSVPQPAPADDALLLAVERWLADCTSDSCGEDGGANDRPPQHKTDLGVKSIVSYVLRDIKMRIRSARAVLLPVVRLPDDILAIIFVERCRYDERLHKLTRQPRPVRWDVAASNSYRKQLLSTLQIPFALARVTGGGETSLSVQRRCGPAFVSRPKTM